MLLAICSCRNNQEINLLLVVMLILNMTPFPEGFEAKNVSHRAIKNISAHKSEERNKTKLGTKKFFQFELIMGGAKTMDPFHSLFWLGDPVMQIRGGKRKQSNSFLFSSAASLGAIELVYHRSLFALLISPWCGGNRKGVIKS